MEERNLLSVAYNNVIGARRASWRIISTIEQKEESRGNEHHVSVIHAYRAEIETELSSICDNILKVLNSQKIAKSAFFCQSESPAIFASYHRWMKLKFGYVVLLSMINVLNGGDEKLTVQQGDMYVEQ
uniref:14-3-3 domain-containing protein n=1 Tax=Salix viminalis TaxID=40686 RepID=A0A6N2M7V9_SALVM